VSGTLTSAGRLGGVGSIHINGTAYMLVSDLVWSPSTEERESMLGMDGYHGYSERHRAGFIAAKLRDHGNLTVGDLNAMVNVDIVASLANGKTVYGHEMVSIAAQEVNATDGTFDVRFEGPRVWEG